MSWPVARLGSRFTLFFEPQRRRVMHSALGRFFDQPLDLAVGLVEPDGSERVLPFTADGQPLYNLEQFERVNSITFRGYSENYGLRFELNVHSVFYPQQEELCLLPALYLEMRINAAGPVHRLEPKGPTPSNVKLFIRLRRPETQITACAPQGAGRIELAYRASLDPGGPGFMPIAALPARNQSVAVTERIQSLNPDCSVSGDGTGLVLDLPVTEVGSGIKWRLVWGAYCGEEVLLAKVGGKEQAGKLRYTHYWQNLDQVMDHAIRQRDDYLAHSRRFDKFFDQSSLTTSARHLINLSFQNFLGNSVWCDLEGGGSWFSDLEGNTGMHSTLDVEYNVAPLYLTLWPALLEMQLDQWSQRDKPHQESGGAYLSHDLGYGSRATGQAFPYDMPVEENCNFLLLLQTYAHWTGQLEPVRRHGELIARLTRYLLWTDRDGSGFVSQGCASSFVDASPGLRLARKQTYLAIKRLVALSAAADLLAHSGQDELAARCTEVVERDAAKVEVEGWLGDHFALCVDRTTAGVQDPITGKPLALEQVPGWDAYSIYTGNGLLLPALIGQPNPLDVPHLVSDLHNSTRETMGPYGCSHSSIEPDAVWISQNIWRDHLLRYLGGASLPGSAQRYWDLQVMSNTTLSRGFAETYIGNDLSYFSRGAVSMGYLLSEPRLVIDRLAPGGQRICVEPSRHLPQRWPLLALADWKAGKIPICVVAADGRVFIENETDPVIIRGSEAQTAQLIG